MARVKEAEIGRVPADWEVAELRSFLERITYGFTNPMPTTEMGPWKLTAADIQGGIIDYVSARHTSQKAFEHELTDKSRPQINDVLLTKDGSIGRVAVVDRSPVCINQSVALLRPNPKIEPQFLKYLLAAPFYQRKMAEDADGTTILHIYITRVDKMQVAVPPPKEQRKITSVLCSLDKKIELNRQMNKTLEGIARTIFKSWFVDFDPVRAKAAGRQPFGRNTETAALFPDSFQDSPLGKIPREWRVTDLGEICEVIDCLHSKKPDRSDRGKPLLQLWNIRDDGLLDMSDTYWISADDYHLWTSRIEARPGDCVITNVGRVGAVSQIPFGTFAALGRNMTAVRTKSNYAFPTLLIECLLSSAMRQEIESNVDSGTILDSLNVRNIPKLRLVLPPIPVAKGFEALCRPLRYQMEMNQAESSILAAIRDTLLPKLISGEIRVEDAEKFVEKRV